MPLDLCSEVFMLPRSTVPLLCLAFLGLMFGVQPLGSAEPVEEVRKLTATVESLKATIQKLEAELKTSNERLAELLLQHKKLKEEALKAQTELQAALENRRQLAEKLAQVERKLGVLGDNAGKLARNPPPAQVSGKVKAVEADSGLITISVGSDSGLAKGHTLEVYRLSPKPLYLGYLRIVDVRAKDATGKIAGTSKETVQVGDDVASAIGQEKKP
jgi:hypothetical protein